MKPHELADTLQGHSGRVLGKFRLEHELGRGAMGTVYLGTHVDLGHAVAVKVLSADAIAQKNGVERFFNEARAIAAINHENVVRVIDFDRLPDGTPYIVMEYVEGQSLRELLFERGALPLRTAVALTLDVLAALEVAHERGIVHRDLKPENIRVTPAGRARVLDFGVAKHLAAPSTQLTEKGALIGTPHYMAPEQVAGTSVDGRADLYAVGVMLFECITGRRPFEGQTLVELLRHQVDTAPPRPTGLRPEVPLALEQVMLRLLEKDRDRRFASATEVRRALRSIELPTSELTPATPYSASEAPTPDLAYLPTNQPTPRRSVGTQQATPPALTERAPSSQWKLAAALSLLVVAGGAGTYTVLSGVLDRPPVVVIVKQPAEAAAVPPPARVVDPPSESAPVPAPAPRPAVARPTRVAKAEAPAPAPQPVKAVEPPPPAEPASRSRDDDSKLTPIDFDPANFDPLAWVAKAEKLARERMSDAVLIMFDTDGVFPDGHVDLTLTSKFEARYFFRSPSRSVLAPMVPDDDQDVRCLVHVIVTAKNIDTYTTTSVRACREPPLPKWKCSLRDAMRGAASQGARTDKAATVEWLKTEWYVTFEPTESSLSVPCP